MENLVIDSGKKRLMINGNPEQILEFAPTDALFVERFHRLVVQFDSKIDEFTKKSNDLDKDKEVDEAGIPKNMSRRIGLLKEACIYIRGQIDSVFGEGVSQMLFGDTLSIEAHTQFFEGIVQHIKQARSRKVAKYQKTPDGKNHRVMK
jgi:hypothetical protein